MRHARFLAFLLLAAPLAHGAEPAAKQFLSYIYGAEGINLADISHPSPDLWMVRGAKNPQALAALDGVKFEPKRAGVYYGTVRASEDGPDLYFIEMRDGLVDPAINLDQIYFGQRQLILHCIYAALGDDSRTVSRLVTNDSGVEVTGPRAPRGDMDQYGSIIQMMPVVRSSNPVDDAKTRTITYRVPVSDPALLLTLVKQGSTWKIDTSKKVQLSLEFFYR